MLEKLTTSYLAELRFKPTLPGPQSPFLGYSATLCRKAKVNSAMERWKGKVTAREAELEDFSSTEQKTEIRIT